MNMASIRRQLAFDRPELASHIPTEVETTDQMVRQSFNPVVQTDESLQWRLRRNCNLSPVQLVAALSVIAFPSILTGVGFLLAGVHWVGFFSGVELLALAIAFVWYSRNAGDYEWIRIRGDRVEVKVQCGTKVDQQEFHMTHLTLTLAKSHDGLLTFHGSGRSIAVGRHVPRHLREELHRSICAVISKE